MQSDADGSEITILPETFWPLPDVWLKLAGKPFARDQLC
jgi:hypothetical protein